MRRISLSLALASTLVAITARADFTPGWTCYAPGVCLFGGRDQCSYTPGRNGPTPAPIPARPTTITPYIIWYGSSCNSTEQHAVVDGFFANINSSPWLTALNHYYPQNSLDRGANQLTTIGAVTNCFSGSPAHCSTDPENEGTNNPFETTIIHNEITAGHLPSDANGMYFVLPCSNDITNTASFGMNAGGGPNGGIMALREFCPTSCTGSCPWSNITTPSGDCQFDFQVWAMSAELAGAFGNFNGNGWQAGTICPGASEIHEECTIGKVAVSAFETPGHASANWTAQLTPTRYDFILYPVWMPVQGGICEVATIPSFYDIPCNTGADCPSYSGVCGLQIADTRAVPGLPQEALVKHCLPPTCTDGVKNGTETDTDCGGNCGATNGGSCASGQHCAADIQCASSPFFCDGGTCQ